MKSDSLVESKTLREAHVDRTEILDKVKKLELLPDDVNASMELTAEYFEVGKEAINSCIKENRIELESDGVRVLIGDELKSLKDLGVISKNTASFTVVPRRAILRIGMLLRDSEVARALRDRLLDVESERPKAEQPKANSNSELLHFQKETHMLGVVADMLRLPDSGRLKLLGDFNEQHGLVIPLPAYVDEEITESASALLEKHEVGISAMAFNQLLMHHNLLEKMERLGTSGSKKFKSLTDTGQRYGKNLINPKNARETQPHYYARTFPELLSVIGLTSN
ncbi:hypothetical protein FHS16_001761 [Paenibacillus endophyticus]|uniref:Antirepressor protein C-terminal domain-containing protein n=1 Tax=Paenibacillus endophyticus TaxID=1294268 RepID=A0A7W5C5W6_9BACL|nr:hypothetical protein [Paenibacillus endophyticus]MBB3151715.1 hypothetical protein [Paenibacillus endophyticus]